MKNSILDSKNSVNIYKIILIKSDYPMGLKLIHNLSKLIKPYSAI